jgi:hypothetical protein
MISLADALLALPLLAQLLVETNWPMTTKEMVEAIAAKGY